MAGFNDFHEKTTDCMWCCTRVTGFARAKVVESCSKAQKMWQVFQSVLEKNLWLEVADFL